MIKNYTTHFQGLMFFAVSMIGATMMAGLAGFTYAATARHYFPIFDSMIASLYAFSTTFTAIIFGVLMPLGFAFSSWTLREHLASKRIRWMGRAFRLYATGTIILVAINFYADIAMTIAIAQGRCDLTTARNTLFFSLPFIGTAINTMAYLLVAAGTIWYATVLGKTLDDTRKVVGSLSALDLK